MWEVVIAGGGPAGSVAAHRLSRTGHKVLLIDQIKHRHKVGEALPAAAVRLLRSIDLKLPLQGGRHTPISGNLSAWDTDDLTPSDFVGDPDGLGWRLNRLQFDNDLREAAIREGTIFENAMIRKVARVGRHWHISLTNGMSIEALWVIDATGRRASLARQLGASRKRDIGLIATYAFAASDSSFELNRTVIEAVPDGWWYIARLPSSKVLVGFHTRSQVARKLRAHFNGLNKALMETRYIYSMLGKCPLVEQKAPIDASGGALDCFINDGWLACGDAALTFDPLLGQGILSALYTGILSARTVHEALEGDAGTHERYTLALDKLRRTYLLNSLHLYRRASRWSNHPFWAFFHEPQMTDASYGIQKES